MFSEHRGNTNVFSGEETPPRGAADYKTKKSRTPVLRTLEPRMVFDAAAVATAEHAPTPAQHPEPATDSGHVSAGKPMLSHLAEALKAVPVTPVDKSTEIAAPAPEPAPTNTTVGDPKGDNTLAERPQSNTNVAGAAAIDENVIKNTVQTQLADLRPNIENAVAEKIETVVAEKTDQAADLVGRIAGAEHPPSVPEMLDGLPETAKVAAVPLVDKATDAAIDTLDAQLNVHDVSDIATAITLEAKTTVRTAIEHTQMVDVPPTSTEHAGTQDKASTAEPAPDRPSETPSSETPTEKPTDGHAPVAADRVVTDPRASEPKNADATAADGAPEAAPKEVYFIWDNVKDWQQIAASLGPGARVYVLDSSKDGVEQIAAILKGERNITAIHIISHGSEGSLSLGTAVLDAESMQGEYRDELMVIGQALSENGDILIYGCDFAAGADGLQATAILSDITKADVAASTDSTGAAALGGDWDLERKTGAIETQVFADYDYDFLLVIPAVDLNGPAGGADSTAAYTEQAAPVSIVATGTAGATVTDTDNDLQRITIVANAAPNGNSEHLNFNGTAIGLGSDSTTTVTVGGITYRIVYTAATRTFVITNNAGGNIPSGGSTNTLVRSITYDNSADNPSNSGTNPNRVFTFTATDAAATTSIARTSTVTITAVNDAPVDGNETNTVTEDTTLTVADGAAGDLLNNATDPDGNPVAITGYTIAGVTGTQPVGTAVVIAGAGTITINANGSYSFVPLANFTGTIPVITYTISDGNGGTDTSTLSLTMVAVNDPPVDGNETNTVTEDTTLTVADGAAGDLLNNATDIDGGALTISGFTVAGQAGPFVVGTGYLIAGVGTITINANGSYSFVPLANFAGTIPIITYTVSDGNGGTDTSTLTLTMIPVNDAPVDGNETNTVTEDTTLTVADGAAGDLLNNATDPDGNPVAITGYTIAGVTGTQPVGTAVVIAGAGTITINANGSYSFVPLANFTGTIPVITYTISDGNGGTDTSTLSLTMVAVNDPPVDGNETNTVTEDTTLTVADGAAGDLLNNATDIDGGALTISGFTVAGQAGPFVVGTGYLIAGVGTITINANGSYSFVPASNFVGTIPIITYTVSDGNGGTDTSTLTLTMVAANDAPAGTNNTVTLSEDTSYTFTAASFGFTDPNDTPANAFQAVIITTLPPAAQGTLLLSGAPVTVGQTISLAQIPNLTFQPAANVNGNGVGSFTFQVVDDGGTANGGENTDQSPNTFAFNITPVNDPPVANDDTATTPEDTTLNGNVLTNDTDVDGDTLTVTQFSALNVTAIPGQTGTIPGVGQITMNADGSYTFVPVANFTGPVPVITYTISDGNGGTATATLNIEVISVNDPPVDGNETNTVIEDTTLTVVDGGSGDLLNNSSDLDGDPLTITDYTIPGVNGGNPIAAGTATLIPGVGTITINANGSYSFVPAANYDGPIPVITYTVSDGTDTDTSTLTLTMTPVNDAPIAQDDAATTPENTPVSGNVLDNDTDVDDTTLTVTFFTINGQTFGAGTTAPIAGVGTILINADGSYTFTPAPSYDGPVPPVTYTVSDGELTDTAVLQITITPLNDPPVADDETGTTPEDTTLSVPASAGLLVGDTDVDGDPLTVTEFEVDGTTYTAGDTATITGVGNLTINADGSYTFVPAPNYNGPVPVATYTVSDDNGATDQGTLTLNVTPVNDPPVAVDDTGTTPEDTSLSGNVLTNDTDVDTGDTLTVVGFTVNGTSFIAGATATLPEGTITINTDGTYTLVPAANYTGPVPVITYVVVDGSGATTTATLTLDVTPVNDPPVATDDNASTPQDTPLSGNVINNDSDVDGDPIVVTEFTVDGNTYQPGETATIPGVGDITINADGSSTFVPAPGYVGPVPDIDYTISDGNGGTDQGTLHIDVIPDTSGIGANDDIATTPEDTTLNGNVLANDIAPNTSPISVVDFMVDGDPTVYAPGSTATIAGIGALTINLNGSYTFVPAPDYFGPVPVVTYTATNGTVNDTATLTITVTPVNDPPVAVNDIGTTPEDTTLTGNVLTNDSDVDSAPLTVTQFVVEGITLNAGQTAPIPNVGQLTINANGSYTFVPAPDYNGPVPVATYTISDGDGGTATGTLTIAVTPVNDAPVAVNDTNTIPEDTVATGNVLDNDTDVEGAALTVTGFEVGITAYAAGETATIAGVGALTINADGSYSFVPAANYNGPVPVATYTVSDGALTAAATLTITITPVNDAPVANDDTATLAEDTTLTVPAESGLLSNDADIENGSLTVDAFEVGGVFFGPGTTATIPGVGELTINADGSYTFTPVADFNGTVPPVTYRVTDGNGGTDTAVLTITVTPVNDAPADGDETNSVVEDTTLTVVDGAAGDLLNNATDIDGIDTLTITDYSIPGINGGNSIAAGTPTLIPGVGTITINANGSYTFAPEADYTGPVPVITYTISDNAGGTDTSTLTLTITPVNDPPVAENDFVSTPEDTTLTGNVLGNDVDVDGDQLTVTLYSLPGLGGFLPGAPAVIPNVGTLTISADGSYTFVPVANYNGPVPIATYTIADASGVQDTADLIIIVTPVNDPPVDGDETNTVTEDTTLTVPAASGLLANATDIDGGPLSITDFTVAGITGTMGSPVAIAGVGTITINADGSYSFTPEPNYTGPIPLITYTVSDGAGGTDTSTLTLTMVPVNDPPVDGDETNTVIEDTTLTVPAGGGLLVNASDIDGGTLTISGYTIAGVTGTQPVGSPVVIAGVGTITINADGSYSFAPATNYAGPIPVITYTVSDGAGGTDTSTLTLTMIPVNDPPVDGDETNAVIEDTTLTVADGATGDLLNNATDVEGDPLTITSYTIAGMIGPRPVGTPVAIAGVGTITINANGSYSFVPVANYTGAIPVITYSVSDGNGGTDTSTLTLTMVSVNDAPAGTDNAVVVAEDTAYTFAAGDFGFTDPNDTPANGLQAVIITTLPPAAEGTLLLSGVPVTAGQTIAVADIPNLTFQPAANVNGIGIGSFTFQVVDDGGTANGGQDTDQSPNTFAFNIVPVNDPPVDGDETNTVIEDTTLTVTNGAAGDLLNNATDVEGNPLTITSYTIAGIAGAQPVGSPVAIAGVGTITINANGSYSFTPAANYTGAIPVITYTVSDGNGGTDTSTLTLTITPVNDPPVDGDETNIVIEDTTLTVANGAAGDLLNNATDVEGDPLTITSYTITGIAGAQPVGSPVAIAGVGTITVNADGSYSFAPLANYTGAIPVITYTVSDGNGGTDTSTLTLTITPVNDPPVDGDETNTVIEDTTLTVSAAGGLLANTTDVDGGTPSVIDFTVAGQTGPFSVGTGYVIAGVGTITINANGSYSFAPAANYTGAIPVITYTVSDGAGGTDTSTLTLTMIPVNDPPVDGNETNTVIEDTTLTVTDGATGDLLNNASDVEGDPLTITGYTIAGIAGTQQVGTPVVIGGIGTITINANGSYSFTPVANFDGAIPVITYTVSDGNGGTDNSTLTLTMIPVNDPPVATDDTGTTLEDTTLTGNVLTNDTDIDGGPLRVTQFVVQGTTYTAGQTAVIANVGSLTINALGGYRFVPALNYNGPVPTTTYTVSDGNGGTDTATLTITITPVNDPPGPDPVLGPLPPQNSVDGTVVVPVLVAQHFIDVDGDVLTYAARGLPPGLSINPITGIISGRLPNDASQASPYVVVVTATDPSGLSSSQLFIWRVSNPIPIANDDVGTIAEDTVLTGNVMANDSDPDNDPLQVTQFTFGGTVYAAGQAATIAGVGTMVINADGSYTFSPALNFNGPVPAATYTLSDGNGGFDTATLTITVTPVDDIPILVDDHASGNEDTTITGNVLVNDSDPDGDVLFVTGFMVDGDPTTYLPGETATIPGVGTISLQSNGDFTFIPAPNYDGPVPDIFYTASDGDGGTGQATLVITITPVSDFVPIPDNNEPDLPEGSDFNFNPDDVDGAVVEAVRGLDSLGDIANLDEHPIGATVNTNFDAPIRGALTQFLGGSSTIVIDQPAGGTERIHVSAIRHAGILYLQIVEDTARSNETSILDFRLRSSDGSPAPTWLRHIGPFTFAGHPDANAGTVDLILSVVQRDGQVSDHRLQLDSVSGHLSQPPAPEDHGFEGRFAPMFSEQMNERSLRQDLQRLEIALGFGDRM